jgi:pimeloyl-ACP methyl ester carboxylesterase
MYSIAKVKQHKAYVDTPLGQVHYRDMGAGEPILLLHQSPASSLQYEAAFDPLTDAGYRVIAMDTPGFGESDPPPFVPTIADYASVIPYVLDQAGVDRVNVVGHHTGVEVAFEAAGLYPDRFRKLAAHGVPLFEPEEMPRWMQTVEREKTPVVRDPEGKYLAERFSRAKRDDVSQEMLRVRERNMLTAIAAGPLYWYGHSAAFLYDIRPRLMELQLPLLFLTNTGDMIHEHTLNAHKLRPDAELVVLEGGTIDIIDEQPREWSQAVIDFIRKP